MTLDTSPSSVTFKLVGAPPCGRPSDCCASPQSASSRHCVLSHLGHPDQDPSFGSRRAFTPSHRSSRPSHCLFFQGTPQLPWRGLEIRHPLEGLSRLHPVAAYRRSPGRRSGDIPWSAAARNVLTREQMLAPPHALQDRRARDTRQSLPAMGSR